ncbi:MAG: hypothetical protein N5P05_000238 [Chroococcopsis gigantea SAG 12.99]|jgi:murein DD-endopeptidase MepM/ murein hydrolase activator NlpD|nr:peptidoglycan DD-metalloendopeptidase family protein [Chlorogloea purpurea SAG 13.99]MDV2998632.1 hypothetical protein [Chroococcopsis gigantea SAG 12.99]
MDHPSFPDRSKLKISAISGLALILSALVGQQTSAIANSDNLDNPDAAPNVNTVANPTPVVPEPLKPVPIEPNPVAPGVPLERPTVNLSTQVKPPIVNPVLEIPKNHKTTLPTIPAQESASGKNNFIDNKVYNPPSAVVVTERARGCQTIATSGQLISGNCNINPAPTGQQTAQQPPRPPVNLVVGQKPQLVIRAVTPVAVQPRPAVTNVVGAVASNVVNSVVRLAPPSVAPGSVVALNPQNWNGARLALEPVGPTTSNSNEPATYDRTANLSASNPNQPHSTDLLFPLALPAAVTSVFGWRTNPVTGVQSTHEGTDLGAPIGTPVLAAYKGEVAVADWVGGYGLTVILRHLDGTQESRYGHLSEITVKPGQWVEQGTVIGKVGSTGISTGPHLHFEWRHNTAQGWVAVDAGVHLEYALENLVQRMRTASENNTQPQG